MGTMAERHESDGAVRIERTFDAPAELVWRMWTDPGHFSAWYGPTGATIPVATMDVRVGGRRLVCTDFHANFLNLVPAEQVEGLYSCLDYYQAVDDPFSKELLDRYNSLFPGSAMFTGGSACSGMSRGLRRWGTAVEETGSADPERDGRRGLRPTLE